MTTRSRLYTRIQPSHTRQHEIINLVVLNNHVDEFVINDDQVKVKIFTEENVDSWFDYITIETDIINVCLFVSNIFIDVMLQSICEYPQIKYVYIFGKDPRYQNSFDLHGKFKGIFNHWNEMLEQFKNDINETSNKFYSKESTFKNINEESSQILWWTFFDRTLQYITYTNIAMDELIEFFRVYYQERYRYRSLLEIEEFKTNYNNKSAILWYTRESFFYRLLNRTLRMYNNLNDIFKFRFVIKDITSQLKDIQTGFSEFAKTIVYRGQQMSCEQIKQLQSNIGKIMFLNTFISTSLGMEVARMFVGDSYDHLQSILIIIHIDSIDCRKITVPFANITHLSTFDQEEEVLFAPHSTFEIQSVELQQENNLWHVHLKYVNNTWNIDFGERSIFSPHADQIYIRKLSDENKQFIAFQLLLDMLLRLNHNNYAMKELLEFSRSKYHDNQTKLEEIDDFEREYCSKDAAIWYTKNKFLYPLLNETLREEKIDSIVKMRYYIYDLHNELAELQLQQFDHENNLILYRGQPMKIHQLNEIKENFNGYISFNSFTSATEDQNVAFFFSGDGTTTSPDEISVIFEILADTNIRSTPFARIRSAIIDEQEILFSMGAVFRIGDVNEEVPDHSGVQWVKLTLEHFEDELWNKLTRHLD